MSSAAVVAARAVQRTREPGRAAGGCERQTDHAPEPSGGEDQHQHEETGTCLLISSVYLNTTGMGVSTKRGGKVGWGGVQRLEGSINRDQIKKNK